MIVETTDCVYNLGSVDLGSLFSESLLLPEVGEHLSSVEEVNNEVKLSFSLEGVVQSNDVWVLHLFKNISLGYVKNREGLMIEYNYLPWVLIRRFFLIN